MEMGTTSNNEAATNNSNGPHVPEETSLNGEALRGKAKAVEVSPKTLGERSYTYSTLFPLPHQPPPSPSLKSELLHHHHHLPSPHPIPVASSLIPPHHRPPPITTVKLKQLPHRQPAMASIDQPLHQRLTARFIFNGFHGSNADFDFFGSKIHCWRGLRYDDLYDPMESLDIKEALARLPREIVDGVVGYQRLLRAMYLSMKHEYLSKDLQCLDVPTIDTSLKCEIYMMSRVRNYLQDQLLGFALIPLSDVIIKNDSMRSSSRSFKNAASIRESDYAFSHSAIYSRKNLKIKVGPKRIELWDITCSDRGQNKHSRSSISPPPRDDDDSGIRYKSRRSTPVRNGSGSAYIDQRAIGLLDLMHYGWDIDMKNLCWWMWYNGSGQEAGQQ
ncbi:hypothetical protein M8C21_021258, partial [Ambrosia artemisiifolia]